MTDVTYMGQVNGTRAALARMRVRDRGLTNPVTTTTILTLAARRFR